MKLFVRMSVGPPAFSLLLLGPLWKTPPCGLLTIGLLLEEMRLECVFKWPPDRVDMFLSKYKSVFAL